MARDKATIAQDIGAVVGYPNADVEELSVLHEIRDLLAQIAENTRKV